MNRAHQLRLFGMSESAGAAEPDVRTRPEPLAPSAPTPAPRSGATPPAAAPGTGVTPKVPAVAAVPPLALVPPLLSADVPVPSPDVSFVRHPRARRYLIRVRLDGRVRVTIPRRGSQREAEAFYRRQLGWVTTQLQHVAEVRERLPEDLPDTEQQRLRAQAKRELPPRLFELAAEVGVTVCRVSVRNQRQRWGSCSQSGLICLNWRLITMPAWVRDYVLYHELMHVKQMDHSPAFWALVAGVCPDYQQARRWLRRHAHAPHTPGAHADAARGAGQCDAETADDDGC